MAHRFIQICAAVFTILFAFNSTLVAQDTKLEQQVNLAIDDGVAYLKAIAESMTYKEGIGLIGWALLESGVDRRDPSITRIAEMLREKITSSTYNYGISLAIIFFDRLGDPTDSLLIQTLATHLLTQQRRSGGWGYGELRYPIPDQERDFLKEYYELIKKDKSDPMIKQRQEGFQRHLSIRINQANSTPINALHVDGGTDNSNSQFAALALWVARRHGVPTDRALRLNELRFYNTQYADGKWGYYADSDNSADQKTLGMTGAGLISIALGRATVPQLDLPKNLANDIKVRRGLIALSSFVSAGLPIPSQNQEAESGKVFYALWCLERVGVLYNLQMIGGKDWYTWGAQYLVEKQSGGGIWRGAYENNCCADTCFALLFLKRANATSDITKRLKGKLLIPLEKSNDGKKQSSRNHSIPSTLFGLYDPVRNREYGLVSRVFKLHNHCAGLVVMGVSTQRFA